MRDDSARIDDLNAAAKLDAERLRGLLHALLAADQKRGTQPLLHERGRRADHLLLFTFGKDHAPRLPAQHFEHPLQHAGDRVTAAAQLLPVFLHIDDRPARHLRVHRRLGDGGRNGSKSAAGRTAPE